MTELEFGERLKNYRKARGLTQQELADRLGVSNKSVSRWESGGYPDVATLGPLARALGVTVDDLLGESPPLRRFDRAEWQNLLSFAFAIGGGVLYFLLDLFVPVLVCFALYLGADAYGVYLQQHYTFHSKWFRRASLLMSFFVCWSLAGQVGSAVLPLAFPSLALSLTQLAAGLFSNSGWLSLLAALLVLLLVRLLAAAGLALVTQWAACRLTGETDRLPLSLRLRLERVPFTLTKALPALGPVLAGGFWCLYLIRPPLPDWFYLSQEDLFGALLAILAGLSLLWLLVRRRFGMVLPALTVLALSACHTGLLTYPGAYSRISGEIFQNTGSLNYLMYVPFGQPTWGTLLLTVALTILYLACCRVRVHLDLRTSPAQEHTGERGIS